MSVGSSLLKWPKVLLYGDSITQFSFSSDGCWGTLLADKLQRKCDVVNRGFSGYNSRWCSLMLPRILDSNTAKDVVAMTIFLGANDSVIKDLNPKQHVPIEEYKENLGKMVHYLNTIGVDRNRVILIGPPPCDVDMWGEHCRKEGKVLSKCLESAGRYSKVCAEAASEAGVEFVELYDGMMSARKDWSSYLCDGLHLSAEGSKFVFNKLWPVIEARTSHLPALILPHWSEVDHNDPAGSLLNTT